jgi:hypothetical protein
VLGVYERCGDSASRRAPQIEHCTLVTPAIVRRIKSAGVIPLPLPVMCSSTERKCIYGEERLKFMFAMRDFLDAGIRAARIRYGEAGRAGAVVAIEVTRTDSTGRLGREPKITREAIRCSTMAPTLFV